MTTARPTPRAAIKPSVLVLGGGPDAEREVSLRSAKAISDALASAGCAVTNQTIDRLTGPQLAALAGDVIFPALHGGWGEGGPLQDLLEDDGRPFVGCGGRAARHAMDKLATKLTAAALGIPTPAVHIYDPRDGVCPLPFPVVVKPVHEGSTIGLYVCRTQADWDRARRHIQEAPVTSESRSYMIEPCICRVDGRKARELTVGILDDAALPAIEITPAVELYDYEAKYNRDDTGYRCAPNLPPSVGERIAEQTLRLAKALGVRHLARADFMLDDQGTTWFLEINTLPGFTDHSLVPMAARHIGVQMPELCDRLVAMALRDAKASPLPAKRDVEAPAAR